MLTLLHNLLLVAALPLAVGAEDLSEPNAAVESAREGLRAQWNMPWYDAEADDLRPVQVKVRKPPTRGGFWDWLRKLFVNWNLYDVLRFVMYLALATAVVWLVYHLAQQYLQAELNRKGQGTFTEAAQAHLERVEALPVAVEEPTGDYLVQARRAAAAGQPERAIAYLFAHKLLLLDEFHRLRLVKGKTNRQYLAEVRRNSPAQPAVAQLLQRTTLLFEASFFGHRPPERESLEACFTAVSELDAALRTAAQEQAA